IHAPQYFDRDGVYGDSHAPYRDNAERYIAFSKAVVHLARHLPWQPEIVHGHDWPTGLVSLLIHDLARRGEWPRPPRVVFTIHNLAYQGVFPQESYALTNLGGEYFHPGGCEFHGALNLL